MALSLNPAHIASCGPPGMPLLMVYSPFGEWRGPEAAPCGFSLSREKIVFSVQDST